MKKNADKDSTELGGTFQDSWRSSFFTAELSIFKILNMLLQEALMCPLKLQTKIQKINLLP